MRGQQLVFTSVRGKKISKSGFSYYWTPIRTAFHAALPADHHLNQRVAKTIAQGKDPRDLWRG